MKIFTIETKKDIILKKGDIIPIYDDEHSNTARNTIVNEDFFIPKGSILQKRNGYSLKYWISESQYIITPLPYSYYRFIRVLSLYEHGAEEVITEDNKSIFKMFSLIIENRIVPEKGMFITEFEAENIEEAKGIALEFYKRSNLPVDFKYCVTQ